MIAALKGPHIDWMGLSPLLALFGGATLALLVGLAGPEAIRRRVVPVLSLAGLGAALGLSISQWGEHKSIISGALAVDELALTLNFIFIVAASAAVLLSLRAEAAEEAGHGEFHALLLTSVAGMVILVAAQNTITLFLGLELLSIPLYVLCASEMLKERSLESGLKYLIVGSVGSATLLYGIALLYGATNATDYSQIAAALSADKIATDPLTLTGVALVLAGLGFKASVAPFHQWTPDVYEGAPTPITAFMAVATKAAAFGLLLRFFDVALISAAVDWAPIVAVLAAVSIVVGNVGALAQRSLKRMLAWSGVAQAGYLLAGLVVATQLGARAMVFYLAVYTAMNLAAFAVVIARERATGKGDDIDAVRGLGAENPWLAWPLTIAMLALAGIPATAGFIGKFYLIDAAIDGGYSWLGVAIVLGSAISLAYYLRVVAAMWMPEGSGASAPAPAIAGGSPEADAAAGQPVATIVAILFAAATLFFGIVPTPLLELSKDAARALGLL
jgi:NADH-quinone oxidoreductase subunit N